MENLGPIMLTALALYRFFTSDFFKRVLNGNSFSERRGIVRRRISVQDIIKKKRGIKNAYGYTPGLWIGHKEERGVKTYFMLSDDAAVLAKTTVNGAIHPAKYPTINRLILKIYTDIEDDEGCQTVCYGSVDDDFQVVIPPIYQELEFEKNYYAIVKKNELYGVYNSENKLVVPVDYESIIHDNLNRRFFAQVKGVCRLFDYKGNTIKEFKCDYICLSRIGERIFIKTFIAQAGEKKHLGEDPQLARGKWGLLNASCDELIPAKYDLLYNSPDYAVVMSGGLVAEPAQLWPGMDTYYLATGGKWGVTDFNQLVLVPVEHDWIDFTCNPKLFLVNHGGSMYYLKTRNRNGFWGIQKGKWGLIDIDNQVIVPIEYDHINQTKDEVYFQNGGHASFNFNLPYQTISLNT